MAAETPKSVSVGGLLRDRSIASYLLSTWIVESAAMGQFIALTIYVEKTTDKALNLGLLGLAEFLPAALLVLVSGTVADRFDRRRVASIALIGEMACSIALLIAIRSGVTRMMPFLVIVIGVGTARAFRAPASRSIKVLLAPESALARLVSMNSLSWQSASILGPIIGGLLFAWNHSLPFIAAIVAFAVGSILMSTVVYRRPQERTVDGEPIVSQAVEGLRFIRRAPIVFGAISLDLVAVLFGGAVALLPKIADDVLHVGEVATGFLRAAAGIGAALVGFLMLWAPIRRRIGVALLIAVAVFGAFTVLLGLTNNYAVAFFALMVLSGADAISVFIRATLVPLATPNAMQGRVTAVENVFIGASNELGAFESGLAAAAFGLTAAVVGGGVVVLVVAGLWAVWFRPLRDVDTFADATHASNRLS